MSTYVFQVKYGGLGDHLFYSPLPRLLKEYGIADKVYISNQSLFRNTETYNFVWATNPYLDGKTDEAPTPPRVVTSSVNKIINIALSQHGLNPVLEVNPEIYATGLYNERYVGKHYIDFNYTSYVGAFTLFDVLDILKKNPQRTVVNPKSWVLKWLGKNYITTSSLRDYASLIYSSESFSALASGGATLALALGKPSTIFYGYGQGDIFHHSANNNIQVGSDGLTRNLISRFLSKRNELRIKWSRRK